MQIQIPTVGDRTPFRSSLDLLKLGGSHVGKLLKAGGLNGYEPETLAAAAALIDVQGITQFADVGANIGIYSWVMKAVFGDALEVQAFEPLPVLANAAEAIAADNGLTITVRRPALSDANGTAIFYVSRKSDTSNSLAKGFRPSTELEVQTLRMDDAFSDFRPKLIKIDTESTEPAVLAGGDNYIAANRPWMIIEALAGRTEDALRAFAIRHGYLCYHINGGPMDKAEELYGDPSHRHRDWLFAPEPTTAALSKSYQQWCGAFRTC